MQGREARIKRKGNHISLAMGPRMDLWPRFTKKLKLRLGYKVVPYGPNLFGMHRINKC